MIGDDPCPEVLPPRPITNYNTAHSGITAEQMRGVTTTLEDVQRELLELIAAETILIGHSLENDLKRLKLMAGSPVVSHSISEDVCARRL